MPFNKSVSEEVATKFDVGAPAIQLSLLCSHLLKTLRKVEKKLDIDLTDELAEIKGVGDEAWKTFNDLTGYIAE